MRDAPSSKDVIRLGCARCMLPAALGLLMAVSGCVDRPLVVTASQPIVFPHQRHLAYFSSGQHRQEKIQMHVNLLGLEEIPAELAEGKCTECHDDLPARTACAGCHVLFQDAALRTRKDVRRCVACHRGGWVGSVATLPSTTVCTTCHSGEMRAGADGDESRLRVELARDEDVQWTQINTVAPHVYFSHAAHVRFASMTCTTCHQDVSALAEPPTSVRVASMSACVRCHRENGAKADCLTCHK